MYRRIAVFFLLLAASALAQPAETAAIGIDLGGTKLQALLVTKTGEVVARLRRPTDATRGPDGLVADMTALIADLEREAKARGFEVTGVGVSVPGPVDPRTGTIVKLPNLTESYLAAHPDAPRSSDPYASFALGKSLEAAFPGKRIAIGNDANLALEGESWVGGAAGARDAVMAALGTGAGFGVKSDGRIVEGTSGGAGEVGWFIVDPSLPNKEGRLENFISGNGVARVARLELDATTRGLRGFFGKIAAWSGLDVLAPWRPSSLAKVADLRAEDVIREARAGDPLAQRVIALTGERLGQTLAFMVNTTNPEAALVGGGFGAEAFPELAPHIERALSERAFAPNRERVTLARATLGNDAGAIGAARRGLGMTDLLQERVIDSTVVSGEEK